MPDGVALEEGQQVLLTREAIVGDRERFTLWPSVVFETLAPGTLIGVDFDGAMLEITRRGGIRGVGFSGPRRSGPLEQGGDRRPASFAASLSEKDESAIAIGARLGITHYALSFASVRADVDRIRSLAPAGAHIMAKLESRAGVRHMDGVIEAADSIVIIDRGDLSHDLPFESVPYYQKAIVRRANRWNRPVYVATNLLE